MKAVVISGAGDARLTDIAPPVLRTDEVRIKVLATGLCGTDVELFEGTMPYLTSGMAHYPLIPGHEWVGEVCEVGTQVSGFNTGDRVVGECSCGCMRCERCRSGNYHRCGHRTETGVLNRPGAFAEYLNFPACFLHQVSKDISIESACLIEPAAVAYNGVRRAQISPTDDVAIFGDGPVGLLLLMMAKAFGARSVCVVGASVERLHLAELLGADAIVNVKNENPTLALVSHLHGALPSVVIEATGNPSSVVDAVNTVEAGGRIILQGIFAGQSTNGLNLDRIVVSEVTLQGALGSPGVWPDVIHLIESGKVNPGVLVSKALALSEYKTGIQCVKQHVGVKTIVRAA